MMDGFTAERVIGEWIKFYNTERPHSALDGRTPAEAYSAGKPVDMMDKAGALPTSLRWPLHQASLDGTFGQLRPQVQQPQKAFNMNEVLAA